MKKALNRSPSEVFELKVPRKQFVKFEDALEYTGFGKYNLTLILACGLTLLASNIENYSIGYVLPSAECELELTTVTKGILTSSTFFGVLVSSIFWGYLSDRKGRKKLICISLFCTFLASVLASFMPSYSTFLIMRFITGVCISGPSAVIFVYFGEFQSQNNRSKSIGFISIFIALALLLLPFFGWLLLTKNIDFNFFGLFSLQPWRLFMLINTIPNLLAAVMFLFFPESPKYLYYSGQIDQAYNVLEKMYTSNTGLGAGDFPVESLEIDIFSEKGHVRTKGICAEIISGVTDVFRPPSAQYTFTGCFLQAGVFAISSGLLLWYPDIINQLQNNNGKVSLSVCEALSLTSSGDDTEGCGLGLSDSIFIQNFIIGCVYLCGYCSWSAIVKALGNRTIFVSCMVVGIIGSIVLCFVTQKFVIDVMFIALLVLPGVCVSIINAMIVDLMPTNLCGMAVCLTMTAGRLGSMASSSVVGMLLQWNCIATFFIYGGILAACLAAVFVFPKNPGPSTKF